MRTTATGLGGSLRQPFDAQRPQSSSSPETSGGFAPTTSEVETQQFETEWPGTNSLPAKADMDPAQRSRRRSVGTPVAKNSLPAASEITSFALDLNGSKAAYKCYPYFG